MAILSEIDETKQNEMELKFVCIWELENNNKRRNLNMQNFVSNIFLKM